MSRLRSRSGSVADVHAHPFYFVLYLLAAVCYLFAVLVPNTHPVAAYRLQLVALGLLLTLLVTICQYAQS